MMNIAIEGILLGLGLTILLGPLFFLLTQTSIEKGEIQGIWVGFGIWSSDVMYILICTYFAKELEEYFQSDFWKTKLGLICGLILIVFGIYFIIGKNKKNIGIKVWKQSILSFFQGFFVNTFNPFSLSFWSLTVSTAVIQKSFSSSQYFIFFSSIMVTLIITDVMKVIFANKLVKWFKPNIQMVFQKIAGLVFVIYGIYILVSSL